MLKKILLGTAIAAVLSTASYAQNPPALPPDFQASFTNAQNTYNQAKNEPCFNWAVSAAINQLQNDQSSMNDWISMAIDTLLPPVGQSDHPASQVSLNSLAAELPLAKSENNQVVQMIFALSSKPPCVTDQQLRTSGVGLTPQQADGVLRVLLGLPTSDTERTARDHDKTVDRQDDSKTDSKVDTKTDAKVDPKTDSKTENKTELKTETNPEHSTRTVTPEKVDAPKQVARTAPVEHTTELHSVEAHQTISHVTSNISSAHMNSIGNLGSMHEMSAMHMGGMGSLGGMHMGGLGGLGGLGGMHMGGLGGMHFGRM
jgi:hypothetical protein